MDVPAAQLAAQLDEQLARFRLTSFRTGQREVIEAVLGGNDCLCIMPTGGGKSLCYQLPAVARDGVTLVVSPLIALMKDQVDALHDLGIAATFINSSLAAREQFDRMDAMAAGAVRSRLYRSRTVPQLDLHREVAGHEAPAFGGR